MTRGDDPAGAAREGPDDELGRVLVVSPRLAVARHELWGVAFLVGERERYVLRGDDVAAVVERLDGVRDVGQVIAACADLPPGRVLEVLARLEAGGFVGPARAGEPARLAFEAGLLAGGAAPVVELVAARGAEGSSTEAMAAALRAAGFAVAGPDDGGDERAGAASPGVRVVVAADYLEPDCLRLATASLRAGRPCFLVKPSGLRPFLGPYFRGAAAEACPACLADALREQRPVERALRRDVAGGDAVAPRAALAASVAAAANLAAVRLRAIAGRAGGGAASPRLWTLDFPRFELAEHRVRRRPQCRACGDPGLQARIGERPVSLAPVPIAFDADGGSRRESPADAYARLRHLVSPVLGPVTHLHPMPGRHAAAHPVYSSGYLVAPRRRADRNAFDRNCAGKGCSDDQARVSALAEAIERHSGVYRGDEAARQASCRDLGGEAVHPAALQLFSAAQIARRAGPPALPSDERIAWTPAWSLRERRRRWVPLAYCYAEAPAELGATYCAPSSNGSAAGGCLEEAVLQGLYEALERDATALWWYVRARRPAAPVPPSAAAYFDERRRGYEALGWSMWALDLTHDVGLPTVAAVAVHAPSDRLALGFGAHHDGGLALRRAVCELDQVFDPEGRVASPWDGMAASALDHLRPDAGAARAEPLAPTPSRDLRDHVEAWVRRLGELDLDCLVVDKTRPDVDLCVAQVIVPGLRHPWPRFAPGRLYDVPVALGWASRRPAEGELNPRPLLV